MPLLQKSTMTYYCRMSFFTIKRFVVSKLLKHLLLCIIITITPIFITKTPVVASLACFPRTVWYTVPHQQSKWCIGNLIAMVHFSINFAPMIWLQSYDLRIFSWSSSRNRGHNFVPWHFIAHFHWVGRSLGVRVAHINGAERKFWYESCTWFMPVLLWKKKLRRSAIQNKPGCWGK